VGILKKMWVIRFIMVLIVILCPKKQEVILEDKPNGLLRHPSVTVNIDGHCDKIGDKNYNLSLGLKRAEAAKKFLVEQGVDASRITVSSSGKDWQDGISYNDPWQSRFVTVLILSA
jgi:hypothetical protein